MNRVAMRKRVIRIAAVLLMIMGIAFAKVQKLETVQTDGSVSVVRLRVALTFDDGPSPKYTPLLLDGLKERNVHATFFLLGKNIKKNQKLVQRMQREGHLLGNHTYSHVQLDKISETTAKQEILRTNNEIYEAVGIYPEYMRPPYGAWKKNLELCVEMFPVFWDIDTLDWKSQNVEAILEAAGDRPEDGSIILMHDEYGTSVEAAFLLIDRLKKNGYEFVTVDKLISDCAGGSMMVTVHR